MSSNRDLFIEHVQRTLEEWGVETEFSTEEQVYTLGNGQGLACSGFFAELPRPKLAVALGKPDEEWLPILAHEFSHAHQWKEGSALWKRLFDDWGHGREEASDALDRWLEGEEWSGEQLNDIVARIRDIELDCERRTVEMIEKFQLPIDVEEYTQKSNAYVYFYNHVAQTRQWYGRGTAPYQIEDVWQNAPKTFSGQSETPLSLQKAFERHYGPPKTRLKMG